MDSKIVPFNEEERNVRAGHDSDCIYTKTGGTYCSCGPFIPSNRTAAKSSTSVMQASVCQRCGCKLDGKHAGGKIGCICSCHEGAQ